MASMKKDCIAHHNKLVYWFLLLEWQNDSYIIVNIYIYIYIEEYKNFPCQSIFFNAKRTNK
jgi:hypothetical protein